MPDVDLLQALLAFGVFAALVPTGFWVLQDVGESQPRATPSLVWAFAIPVGIAVWSLPLAAAAQAGVFEPTVLGALGWIVTIAASRSLLAGRVPPPRVSWSNAAALIALGVLAWLYGAFPNETLLGSRDEGLYSLAALLLKRTGGLAIDAPSAAAAAPALFQPFSDGQLFFLPGVYQTGDGLRLQFPALLPAWIAQLTAATAAGGLFRASALFALCAVIVFHALARHFLRPRFALLASVVFALNPAQIWIARINLVEPLARLLVLGGLLAAVVAIERRNARLAFVAGALFGVAAFGRLDMVILAPLSVAALLVMRAWPCSRFNNTSATMAKLAVATIVAQSLAVAWLSIVSPVYLRDNAAPVAAAGLATLVVLLLLPLSGARALAMIRSVSSRNVLAVVAAASILLLFAYGALLRPNLEPFALIQRPGHMLDGTRDYRERSLLSLAAYLGWPVMLAAAGGAALALARIVRGRAHAALPLIMLVFLPTAIVLLTNPRVSPDHFWAVRRFVPLVIPGFVLLAGYGAQALLSRTAARQQTIIAGALAVASAVALITIQWPTLLVRENHGLAAQLAAVDASLADSSIVIMRDLDALATTFLLGFGRPVLPLRDAAAPVNDASRKFWSRCTQIKPCMLAHFDFQGLAAGLALGPTRQVRLERRYIAQTPLPLPNGTKLETTAFLMTPVFGLAREPPRALLGAYRDWNIEESGFYREDLLASSSGRWTDGAATIRLPRVDADTLEVRFVVPGTAPRPVRIVLDGTVLHDRPLTGEQLLVFPLPRSDSAVGPRQLRIESVPFNPKAAGAGTDARNLGVWIAAVRQFDSAAPRLQRASVNRAFRSRIAVTGGPFLSPLTIDSRASAPRVTITVDNESDSVWPGGTDVQAGEVPVALGIVWRRRIDGAIAHEQRVGLPFALRPGERILMTPALDPRRHDGSVLPPGSYQLELDLLQEGITWFAPREGVPARLSVSVAAEARADR